jgi:thiol-disulfide isomerase/thioredoxin
MERISLRRVCYVLFCIILALGFDANAASTVKDGAAAGVDAQTKSDAAGMIDKAHVLFREGKYEEALALVDKAIEETGETVDILEFKDDLLWKLNRHEARVENVLRLEQIAERKSPWYCLKIAEADLQLGRKDDAIHWMGIAVNERGFKRVDTFKLDVYDSIREDPRFAAIVEKARENMGIGRPVPDFTVRLLDGTELTLSSLRGKVTLVDFWASWCIPCRKEVPNLKKLYKEHNGDGFEIVGISLDQDKSKAVAYNKENDLRWPMSWSERGYLDGPAKLYMVDSLPSMWLIDRNGILRQLNVGGNELRKNIELLLAEQIH